MNQPKPRISLKWFITIAEKSSFLVIPAFVSTLLIALFFSSYLTTTNPLSTSATSEVISVRQMLGTMLLFALLSGYLIFVVLVQRSGSHDALKVIKALVHKNAPTDPYQPLVEDVQTKLNTLGMWTLPILFLAAVWGVYQNVGVLQVIWETQQVNFIDVVFIFSGCITWVLIAFVLCWRVPVSVAISRLSEHTPINLYEMHDLKPLGRISTTDVLLVAGAMAFMPLQALDAEFRLVNYIAGSVVGIVSALALFFLPLLGIRKNIMEEKRKRLETLQTELATVHLEDTQRLEMVSAHIERITSIPSWPMDLRLVARVFSYLIIPPMAWIAAAFVENFIDSL